MSETDFWGAFTREAHEWAMAFMLGESRVVFDAIDRLLNEHGFDYCFDITGEGETCYFILSPEGDEDLATEIDLLVSRAPPIRGWNVFARRQRKDLSDVRAIVKQLYSIDLNQCRFRHLVQGGSHRVELLIPSWSGLTSDEQQGLADTFLWHALGEDTVMDQRIQSTVQVGVPDGATTLSAHELVQELLGDLSPM